MDKTYFVPRVPSESFDLMKTHNFDLMKTILALQNGYRYFNMITIAAKVFFIIVLLYAAFQKNEYISKVSNEELPREKFRWEVFLGSRGILWEIFALINAVGFSILLFIITRMVTPFLPRLLQILKGTPA